MNIIWHKNTLGTYDIEDLYSNLWDIKSSEINIVEKLRRTTNAIYTGYVVEYGNLYYNHKHVELIGIALKNNHINILLTI